MRRARRRDRNGERGAGCSRAAMRGGGAPASLVVNANTSRRLGVYSRRLLSVFASYSVYTLRNCVTESLSPSVPSSASPAGYFELRAALAGCSSPRQWRTRSLLLGSLPKAIAPSRSVGTFPPSRVLPIELRSNTNTKLPRTSYFAFTLFQFRSIESPLAGRRANGLAGRAELSGDFHRSALPAEEGERPRAIMGDRPRRLPLPVVIGSRGIRSTTRTGSR